MKLTTLKKIPLVQQGDNLAGIIILGLRNTRIKPRTNDIFVIAQKIVSKSEGRYIHLSEIVPSIQANNLSKEILKDPRFIELVLRESKSVLRKKLGTLIVEHKLGFICANAGIDHSNVEDGLGKNQDTVLLLPENPDQSAGLIREKLEQYYGLKFGVLIIDTHGRAWRDGVTGATIGLSGVPGIVDLRGLPDIFGNKLKVTQVAAADELAAGASLIMGQAAEKTPVVHVRGFPYPLRDSCLNELIRPIENDLFR